MGKLKEESGKMEKQPHSRGSHTKVTSQTNEESAGVISKKHFGHVLSTAKKLHGGDPYKASHKL